MDTRNWRVVVWFELIEPKPRWFGPRGRRRKLIPLEQRCAYGRLTAKQAWWLFNYLRGRPNVVAGPWLFQGLKLVMGKGNKARPELAAGPGRAVASCSISGSV